MFNRWSNFLFQSTMPAGPTIFDFQSESSQRFTQYIPKLWSRSNGQIFGTPNPRINDLEYLGLRIPIHKFLHGFRGSRNDIFKIGSVPTVQHIELEYRLLGGNPIDHQTTTNSKFECTVTLGTTWGSFWNEVGLPQVGLRTTTRSGSAWVAREIFRRKISKSLDNTYVQ